MTIIEQIFYICQARILVLQEIPKEPFMSTRYNLGYNRRIGIVSPPNFIQKGFHEITTSHCNRSSIADYNNLGMYRQTKPYPHENGHKNAHDCSNFDGHVYTRSLRTGEYLQ